MSTDSTMRMLIYVTLTSEEQSRLEAIDASVAALLLNSLGITDRGTWTSDDYDGHRHIDLNVAGPPISTVCSMSSGELRDLSDSALYFLITQRLSLG